MKSVIVLLLAFAIWGIVHSVLASHFAKDMLQGRRFYRLGYNVFAAVSLAPIYLLMVFLPDTSLYSVPAPWKYVMFGGQLFAVLMEIIAFLQTDSLSFVGLRQLFAEEQTGTLVTRGLYRLIRHPLYTFGLLFIWLTPSVSQNSFTVYVAATFYILVGAYFEERKLLREFGQAYAAYKRATPMLIPGLMFGKR